MILRIDIEFPWTLNHEPEDFLPYMSKEEVSEWWKLLLSESTTQVVSFHGKVKE